MAGPERGEGRRDSVAVVREFLADWKAGKVGVRDAASVADDLETVRGRLERVQAAFPQARGVGLGDEVHQLLKLLGRQRSVARPRLASGLRRAASLL